MLIYQTWLENGMSYRPGLEESGAPAGHLHLTAETPEEIAALRVLAETLRESKQPTGFDIDEYPEKPTLTILLKPIR